MLFGLFPVSSLASSDLPEVIVLVGEEVLTSREARGLVGEGWVADILVNGCDILREY